MILVYELARLVNRMLKEGILAFLSIIFSVLTVTNFLEAQAKNTNDTILSISHQSKMLLAVNICLTIWLLRIIIKSRSLFFKKYFTLMPFIDLFLGTLIWGQVVAHIEVIYNLNNDIVNVTLISITIIYFYLEHLVFIKIVKHPIDWAAHKRYIKIDEMATVTYFKVKSPDKDYEENTVKTTYRTKWLGMLLSEYVHERLYECQFWDEIIE